MEKMTENITSTLTEKLGNFVISSENEKGSQDNGNLEYGLPLRDVYKLAIHFYKEKEGKAVHFSYEDKLQLVAFTQQVSHGPLVDCRHELPLLGALDVVGKDRREAWQKLGKLSVEQAQVGFVELLSRRCPLFSTFIEAHRREKIEQERKALEEEKRRKAEEEVRIKKLEEEKLVQEEMMREEETKRQIQQALNQQTFVQFKNYAEQQYPGDPEKQGALIRQLQEQHYVQYMQQLEAQRGCGKNEISINQEQEKSAEEWVNDSESVGQAEYAVTEPTVLPAKMWTRSDIQEFKQLVSQTDGDGIIYVNSGETVTVRVPTRPNGTHLFWEFATDDYDLGFGIYFEFGEPLSDEVSVHVSESEEDDYLEELEEAGLISSEDLETGSLRNLSKPLMTEIVPVYRRDCQLEVYAGSHQFPGVGCYLLKFDNSYSFWRSKTLYYRVYYTE